MAHISRRKRDYENLIRFSESTVLSLRWSQIYCISTSSFSKSRQNIRTEKSPSSVFSLFSSLGSRISFISHSQIEDHVGLLEWRFSGLVNTLISNGHILLENGKSKWKSVLIFRILCPSSTMNVVSRFSVSPLIQPKKRPQNNLPK